MRAAAFAVSVFVILKGLLIFLDRTDCAIEKARLPQFSLGAAVLVSARQRTLPHGLDHLRNRLRARWGSYIFPMVGEKNPSRQIETVQGASSVEGVCQQPEARLLQFCPPMKQAAVMKKYQSERKGRRNLDTALPYDSL